MKEAIIRAGLKKRHQSALDEAMKVYGSYVRKVLSNVLRQYGTAEDLEELTDDVFLALWQHSGEIFPGKMKSWLAAVARNKAKSYLRAHRVHLPMDEHVLYLPVDTPEDAAMEQDLKRRLLEAVHHMPNQEKEVFLRYYFEFQSVDEIAERMQIPAGTVKSRLYRGRQRLSKVLQEQEA